MDPKLGLTNTDTQRMFHSPVGQRDKKVNGRKRHILVGTIGLLFGAVFQAVGVQDRDGAPDVLASIRKSCPWFRHIFADGGYAGPKLRGALDKIGKWTLQIVKRADAAQGFEVILRRWVVERTFAWLGRCRRLAKDWGESIFSAEAWIDIAPIRLTTRRLARYWLDWQSFESGSEFIPCLRKLQILSAR